MTVVLAAAAWRALGAKPPWRANRRRRAAAMDSTSDWIHTKPAVQDGLYVAVCGQYRQVDELVGARQVLEMGCAKGRRRVSNQRQARGSRRPR